jgi:hypothetical protein
MGLLDDYLEEEAYRERDLSLNVLMSDGKWIFPVKIRHAIKETENIRINNDGSNNRTTK